MFRGESLRRHVTEQDPWRAGRPRPQWNPFLLQATSGWRAALSFRLTNRLSLLLCHFYLGLGWYLGNVSWCGRRGAWPGRRQSAPPPPVSPTPNYTTFSTLWTWHKLLPPVLQIQPDQSQMLQKICGQVILRPRAPPCRTPPWSPHPHSNGAPGAEPQE